MHAALKRWYNVVPIVVHAVLNVKTLHMERFHFIQAKIWIFIVQNIIDLFAAGPILARLLSINNGEALLKCRKILLQPFKLFTLTRKINTFKFNERSLVRIWNHISPFQRKKNRAVALFYMISQKYTVDNRTGHSLLLPAPPTFRLPATVFPRSHSVIVHARSLTKNGSPSEPFQFQMYISG